ncbi:hypothetical protein APR41_14105 [Salegentibacter salinarum]|uniref:DUF2809 domain-containing protein n=1 Tax=Salegentibacter salinarum TaxID=447422 RepID=A0A2N0U0F1_9FLAO|nr:DUF2809 domain-containing protein [Salegentibacter salinarum]PKD20406.1 hypothetical protein APR41_14105 [Salegentibacter salinarum]SKB85124.1 Protein of unknown function [Salegentibacter salinarum]
MKALKRDSRKNYLAGFLFLLIIEILIAFYVKDDFIRPYLGDFLVVILLYCFAMGISRISIIKGLFSVLIFSFAVEFFQLINIVKVLQYQPPEIVIIMLGSSFSVWDLVAYLLGILCCSLVEYLRNRIYSLST